MARARNIKPDFFLNEALATVSFEARLLFVGLWTLADREGRLEDRPMKIKAAIFPYDDVNVSKLLEELENCGGDLIIRYNFSPEKVGASTRLAQERLVQIVNFCKHQAPHIKEKASLYPAPNEVLQKSPEKVGASTRLAPDLHPLNPESLLLNPESLILNPHTETRAESKDSVCAPFVPSPLGLEMEAYAVQQSLNASHIVNKPYFNWVSGFITLKSQEWATQSGNKELIIAQAWRDAVDSGLSKNPANTVPNWYKRTFEAKFTEINQAVSSGKALKPAQGQSPTGKMIHTDQLDPGTFWRFTASDGKQHTLRYDSFRPVDSQTVQVLLEDWSLETHYDIRRTEFIPFKPDG